MGFKLVRVDATEPCKIPLAVGIHFIGRGKFLDCHDHRVSRNHGQLEVTDDTVRIIALHHNPCFFRRKCSESTNILPQNEYIELSNGDQFGLVPDSYWYELIYCIETVGPPCGNYTPTPVKVEKSTSDEASGSGSSRNVSQIGNTETVQPSISQATQSTFMDTEIQTDMPTTSPYKRPHSEHSNNTVIKKIKLEEPQSLHVDSENQVGKPHINNENQGNNDENKDNENQFVNSENEAVNSENETVNIESQAVNSKSDMVNETSPRNVAASIEDCIPDEGIQDTDDNTSESDRGSGKTTAIVKTEPCSQDTVNTEPNIDAVKTEPSSSNVKTEPKGEDNGNPGPSNNQASDAAAAAASSSADKAAAGAAAPPPNAGAGATPREKCMYGAQCYRVNPVHKARFSHPGDADWAARVPCRWGAACRDIRPAHWRDHDHPPRRDPHERHRPGHGVRVKKVKRHPKRRDSPDSDDSSEQIVTRTRNAGVPNRRIITDESDSEEKDPFASDDTDEWVPSDDD